MDSHVAVDSSESTIQSYIQVLKAPQTSVLSRKSKTKSNPPCGKRKARGEGSFEPKTISTQDRVKQYPEECLTTYNKGQKLFCNACREELSLKKNIINSHISSIKHKTSKEKLTQKEARERSIATSLKAYDKAAHPVGETLPMEQRVYRLKVLKTFLKAAVPLSKLDEFRDILEEGGVRLTDQSHIAEMIPFLKHKRRAKSNKR